MEKGGCLGIGSPVRALSRACDSACVLYVRGMSGCAHRVPTAAGAVAVGRGFGRPSHAAMHLRASSDCRDDLVRAASKQRRVGADPADVGAAVTKGVSLLSSQAPARPFRAQKKRAAVMETIAENARCDFDAVDCAIKAPARPFLAQKKRAAVMETIAENARCDFDAVDCAIKAPRPRRRGVATSGLAARAGGFGAIKTGSGEAFACYT